MNPLHDAGARDFASDNCSGLAPEILDALAAANGGHQISYGADAYTERLGDVVRRHFGERASVWPTFSGTGANVVALQAMLPRWGAVICAGSAHIHTDEGAAPEKMGSLKLLPVPTEDGKLTPELVDREAWGWGNDHRAQPLVVSITQTTELGTCYSVDEIRALTAHAHELGMRMHLDGARIANAAARLDLPLAAFTTEAGVDVLSFGGTKNGALAAEAVVVLDPEAIEGGVAAMPFVRMSSMQLASKMRFVSAQLLALYDGDLWQRNARHSNAMATRLRRGIEGRLAAGQLAGVEFTQDTESNAVFAILPPGVADRLRERFAFYDWDAVRGEVRWVCSFDTTEADVDAFVDAISQSCEG